MYYYLTRIVINIVVYFFVFSALAQTNPITISFIHNKEKLNENGLFEAIIKLTNTSNQSVNGNFLAISASENLFVLQQDPKSIVLNPRETLYISVKAIISTTASSDFHASLEVQFIYSNQKNKISAFLPVLIKEKRLVKMILLETNMLYEQIGDSIRIPVRIVNEGNSAQTITIIANYPEFVTRNRIENISINIKAQTDSLIIIKKEITREILKHEEFSIAIRSLYQNGDIIGIANVRANPIKQKRRYIPITSADFSNSYRSINQIIASRQTSNNNQNVITLYSNAQADTKKGILYTNLDFNWWEQTKQTFMRNTWIGYKQKKYGVQIGNVSKFNDLNMMGRGIETYYKTSENNKIEAGLIEKSYSIIDFRSPTLGQSAWISFTNKEGWDNGYKTSILFDNDSNEAIQKTLVSSQFSIIQTPKFSLQTGGALSNLFSTENKRNELGGAAEVNFHGKTTKLFYTSLNYISTGYFAGIKSGALNLIENINLSLQKYSLWFNANHFSFAPKAINTNTYSPSEFANTQLSIGISKRFNILSLSLSVATLSEKRTEQNLKSNLPQEYKMQANRVNINGSYFESNQNINLSLEGGLFKTNLNFKQQIHFKTSLNYTWKFFNLTSFYQYNNFYLGEIIALQLESKKTYFNLIISPTIQLSIFNKKLRLQTGLMYSKNSFIANTLQTNSRIDFELNKDLSFFIYNFYSDYSNSFKPMNTIQFGVVKHFNPIQIDVKKSDLEVYVFYDIIQNDLNNQNKPASNQLVMINDKAFKTNEFGIIEYKKLPSGIYEIRTINSNEWHSPSKKIKIDKSTKVSIGLSRTCTVKGNIRYLSTQNSFPINKKVAGHSLVLTDKSGNTFYTKTDESGNFTFYVPKNYYTITLEKNMISEYVSIVSNNVNVQVTPETITEINFILQVKEKRVETKKFGNKPFK